MTTRWVLSTIHEPVATGWEVRTQLLFHPPPINERVTNSKDYQVGLCSNAAVQEWAPIRRPWSSRSDNVQVDDADAAVADVTDVADADIGRRATGQRTGDLKSKA